MGPDLTRAYLWPTVNKRLTHLGLLFDPTKRYFFVPKGKELKNLRFLGEIFQTQTQTIDGWPNLTRVKNIWSGPITTSWPPIFLQTYTYFFFVFLWWKIACHYHSELFMLSTWIYLVWGIFFQFRAIKLMVVFCQGACHTTSCFQSSHCELMFCTYRQKL